MMILLEPSDLFKTELHGMSCTAASPSVTIDQRYPGICTMEKRASLMHLYEVLRYLRNLENKNIMHIYALKSRVPLTVGFAEERNV